MFSGISTNSKDVKKNYIFFAIKEKKFNGEKFINEAVIKGASVIICSKSCKFKDNKIHLLKQKNKKFFKSYSFKIL